MKQKYLRIISFLLSLLIFVDCSMTVYALPKRLRDGTWIDVPISEYGEEISYFIQYAVNQMGAFFTKDFETWLKNNETYQDLYDDNGRLEKNVSIDTKTGEVTYTKEIMIVLKTAIDEYAKTEQTKEENGGFIIVPTMDMHTIPTQWFLDGGNYKTFRNLMVENGLLMVTPKNDWGNIGAYFLFGDPFYDHTEKKKTDILLVADKSSLERYKADSSLTLTANFYDGNLWRSSSVGRYTFRDSDTHVSWSEGPQYASSNTYLYSMSACLLNATTENVKERNTFLCSLTGEKVRVFVSEIAAQNYSVGNRKVYFTENYYNYVPEDLSVSIDDLQKTVDDLQKVIDELLKQIGNDTSEKEIMDLLKQILEELRNQQGSGGGNEGGGDVNIDIDLSTTNGLLSKILAKVTQIFDKLSETAGSAADTVHAKLQETLDEILAQIKKLKHWTIADTLIDGITGLSDIITDWADFIGDILSGADDAAEGAVGAVSATMEDAAQLMKTKFPFCIPWDVYLIVGFLAEEPKTPVFELPIRIESYGIDESIVVDLEDFSVISSLSRTLLTVLYCYGLLNLTMKVFPITKEGGD